MTASAPELKRTHTLILPKLQLGAMVRSVLKNRFNGLPRVRMNPNANEASVWSLIGSEFVNR
jgi:hypothetical protein